METRAVAVGGIAAAQEVEFDATVRIGKRLYRRALRVPRAWRDSRGNLPRDVSCPPNPPPPPPGPSRPPQEVYAATAELGEILDVDFDTTLSKMMLDWCEHKDLSRVASWIDASMLGAFVKSVLRVVSYLDVVREVLLGLNEYELYNRLDHHTDLLLGGLVTNESLYLTMCD